MSDIELRKSIIMCYFFNLIFEKQKYQSYSINNIYGTIRSSEELDKMRLNDNALIIEIRERLDELFYE